MEGPAAGNRVVQTKNAIARVIWRMGELDFRVQALKGCVYYGLPAGDTQSCQPVAK